MEDIVAIKVVQDSGLERFFLTWGRIFDPLGPESLLKAVSSALPKWGIAESASVEICPSLQEAASQPYFYEALFAMAQERIPFGPKYNSWRLAKQQQIRNGKEIHYLGSRT